MEKVKVGIFGGRRGIVYINVLMNHPNAEVVAICDSASYILDTRKE